MPYAPGIQNRAGELLAQGINSGGQAISEAIEDYGRRRDELKGYRQVALAMGLPTEQVDKMSLGQIKGSIMANEFKQGQEQYRQKQEQYQKGQRAQAAIKGVLASLLQRTQPQPDLPGTLDLGRGPLRNPVMAAPELNASPGSRAMLESLNQNPEAVNGPEGGAMFGEALKGMLTQPKQEPRVIRDEVTGEKAWWEPGTSSMRPITDKAKIPADWEPTVKSINGVKMFQEGPNSIWKALPLSEQRAGGEDVQYSTDKKFFRTGPQDGWKPVPRSDDEWAGILKRAVGGGGGNGGGGAAATKAAQGGYAIGSIYSGMKYLGGDPNDAANWQAK
jgi:hypothetical protein